jgi:hypothetical protein
MWLTGDSVQNVNMWADPSGALPDEFTEWMSSLTTEQSSVLEAALSVIEVEIRGGVDAAKHEFSDPTVEQTFEEQWISPELLLPLAGASSIEDVLTVIRGVDLRWRADAMWVIQSQIWDLREPDSGLRAWLGRVLFRPRMAVRGFLFDRRYGAPR